MQKLARACYHHRRAVLAAWIVLLVGLSFAASTSGGVFKVQFGLPRIHIEGHPDLDAELATFPGLAPLPESATSPN